MYQSESPRCHAAPQSCQKQRTCAAKNERKEGTQRSQTISLPICRFTAAAALIDDERFSLAALPALLPSLRPRAQDVAEEGGPFVRRRQRLCWLGVATAMAMAWPAGSRFELFPGEENSFRTKEPFISPDAPPASPESNQA